MMKLGSPVLHPPKQLESNESQLNLSKTWSILFTSKRAKMFTSSPVQSIPEGVVSPVQVGDPEVVIDREVPARVNPARHCLSKYKYSQQIEPPHFATEDESSKRFESFGYG
jgi:hypothetical protein